VVLGARALEGIRTHADSPPDFDEAIHLLPALQVAEDMHRLDFAGFLRHSYAQDEIAAYPFLHSWLVAPFFLLRQPGLALARAASVVFLCLSVITIFFLAGGLVEKDWRWLAGLIGAGMTLAALPLWAFASLAYLEAAGLLVSLCALLSLIKAGPGHGHPGWLVAASLFTAGALFTKYSFGLFVLGGIVLSEALGCALARRAWPRRWLYLFGPCAVTALLWFANPAKLARLWAYAHAQHPTMPVWSAESLLFYPHTLARHYAPGPLSLGLLLAGIGLGLWRIRDPRCRAVLCYLLIGLALVTRVPQKDLRFAYTVAPAALALAGAAAAQIVAWLARRLHPRALRYSVAALIVLLLGVETRTAVARLSYLNAAQEAVTACTPDTRRAYQFIIAHTLERGVRPYILDPWHLFNPYALAWEYYVQSSHTAATYDFQLASGGLVPEPTPENLDRLMQALRSQGVGVLVSIDGSPAGTYTGWQAIEPLWARGEIEWLASSERYTLVAWPYRYLDRVFAGDFESREEFEAVRQESRGKFQIQLHLYSVTR